MNIFNTMRDEILAAVEDLAKAGGWDAKILDDAARMTVEAPRNSSHGDIATNVAMLLGKSVGMAPKDLALRVAEALKSRSAVVETAEVGARLPEHPFEGIGLAGAAQIHS